MMKDVLNCMWKIIYMLTDFDYIDFNKHVIWLLIVIISYDFIFSYEHKTFCVSAYPFYVLSFLECFIRLARLILQQNPFQNNP